jgi:hypothetical protein
MIFINYALHEGKHLVQPDIHRSLNNTL